MVLLVCKMVHPLHGQTLQMFRYIELFGLAASAPSCSADLDRLAIIVYYMLGVSGLGTSLSLIAVVYF